MAKKKTNPEPMTPAQRKAAERARYKDAGLVKREIWIKPQHWERISAYLDRISRER